LKIKSSFGTHCGRPSKNCLEKEIVQNVGRVPETQFSKAIFVIP
jgi:hypothetical protein